MSNNTLLKALERMGDKGGMTGYGFWVLAMSTLKEILGYRHEVVDRRLAHAQKDKLKSAYDRATYLDKRRGMMQRWAEIEGRMTRRASRVIDSPSIGSDYGWSAALACRQRSFSRDRLVADHVSSSMAYVSSLGISTHSCKKAAEQLATALCRTALYCHENTVSRKGVVCS